MSRWIATVALILPLASLACGELRTLQVRARAGGGRHGGGHRDRATPQCSFSAGAAGAQ